MIMTLCCSLIKEFHDELKIGEKIVILISSYLKTNWQGFKNNYFVGGGGGGGGS